MSNVRSVLGGDINQQNNKNQKEEISVKVSFYQVPLLFLYDGTFDSESLDKSFLWPYLKRHYEFLPSHLVIYQYIGYRFWSNSFEPVALSRSDIARNTGFKTNSLGPIFRKWKNIDNHFIRFEHRFSKQVDKDTWKKDVYLYRLDYYYDSKDRKLVDNCKLEEPLFKSREAYKKELAERDKKKEIERDKLLQNNDTAMCSADILSFSDPVSDLQTESFDAPYHSIPDHSFSYPAHSEAQDNVYNSKALLDKGLPEEDDGVPF